MNSNKLFLCVCSALSALSIFVAPVTAGAAPNIFTSESTSIEQNKKVLVALAELVQSDVLNSDDFKALAKTLWRSDNNKPQPWEKNFNRSYDDQNDAGMYQEYGPEYDRVIAALSKLRFFPTQDPAQQLTTKELNDAGKMLKAIEAWLKNPFYAQRFATAFNGTRIEGEENVCAVPSNGGDNQRKAFTLLFQSGGPCNSQ
jgi:hypothetical protein